MNAKLSKSSQTILLLDADPEHFNFVSDELQARGFFVLKAETLEEALETIRSKPIHLVIIDLELSRAEKSTLFKQVLSEHNIPVLWLIAPSLISREEAYAAGASAILSKPIVPENLELRIREMLVPAHKRWKAAAATQAPAAFALEATVENIDLGRGGISVNVPAVGASLFEGQRIQLKLQVNESQKWALNGTGILRYIKMDKRSQEPKAWGIEFESLEASSLEHVLKEINQKNPSAFIPTLN